MKPEYIGGVHPLDYQLHIKFRNSGPNDSQVEITRR